MAARSKVLQLSLSSFRAIKDGYESDSTLSYRRHNYVPLQNSSSESKNLYTHVQKGGEVPMQGLRMQAPEKKGKLFFHFFLATRSMTD